MTDELRAPTFDRRIDRRSVLAGGVAAVVAACSSGSADSAISSPAGTTGVGDATQTSATAVASTGATSNVATPPTTIAETAAANATLTVADFDALGTCTLLGETAAGPFPLDEQLDRRDVTEGYPGHPLRLGLRVVGADCVAVPGAVVEIWHTDASGDYSAFTDGGSGKDEGSGTTFMRGSQAAGDDGIVEFTTIYPGWYEGRVPRCAVVHRCGEPSPIARGDGATRDVVVAPGSGRGRHRWW